MTFSKSENITELAVSLSKAQALIQKADKEKTNPHFKSKYADLGNIVDAIKPAISQHGLSFIQVCNEKDDHASVSTIIIHSSGEWINCGAVSVPVDKKNAQGYGSALTYARRYSLASAFGVASDDDDDGNEAAKAKPDHKNPDRQYGKNNYAQSRPIEKCTPEQLKKFDELIISINCPPERLAHGLEMKGCKSKEDMTREMAASWIISMEETLRNRQAKQTPASNSAHQPKQQLQGAQ